MLIVFWKTERKCLTFFAQFKLNNFAFFGASTDCHYLHTFVARSGDRDALFFKKTRHLNRLHPQQKQPNL